MAVEVDVSKLPRETLERALKLKNAAQQIYIMLCCYGESMKPKTLADALGLSRAHVHMRLCQLEAMGYVKRSCEKSGHTGRRCVLFEVIV